LPFRAVSAERAGIDPGTFPKVLWNQAFGNKPSSTQKLRESGSPWLFPVVPGPGGANPGQNRDKSARAFSRFLTHYGLLSVALLLLLGMAQVAASDTNGTPTENAKKKSESDTKLQRTLSEIRQLVAEFHALLPREKGEAIGAAYARFSTRFQDSIVDQIRAIFADAVRKRIFIPLENVFFDLGVRGCKSDRVGLNQLRGCLDRKAAKVVFFFATNRLFRKVYRSLQFVEEQVVDRGLRAVFVKSGVDTADTRRWRGMLTMNAMMDEFVVGMNADHIRAAHEGLLDKRVVFGTVSFGYTGEPTDGPLTRRGLPRKRLVVDPVAGPVVETIFRWYSTDRLFIDEIVRRLNDDPMIPPPPKSPGRVWTHDAVRKLLSNSRYRGCWRYGVTESVWVSSKDYTRQVVRKEPLKSVQIEALRLVSDELWYAAQSRLAVEIGRAAGRKPRDGNSQSRPRLLNGLFRCPVHDRILYVGGIHGRYMVCKECRGLPAEKRPLFSQLPRTLALRKTCEVLTRLIVQDGELVERVIEACRVEASRLQTPDPNTLKALTARRDQFDRRVAFVLRNPGETDADLAASEAELKRLRGERAAVQTDLDAASAAGRSITIPSKEEVQEMLARMPEILSLAADGESAETAGLVRELIDRLTGGRIELEQVGERKAQQGWLRGRFRFQLVSALTAAVAGRAVGDQEADGTVIEIEYRDDELSFAPDVVADVKRLYTANMMIKEIAGRLGLNRNNMTKILSNWFEESGIEPQDGRTRRAGLPKKHLEEPLYQEIADRVKELADSGGLFGDIADELEIDRNTVTAAWRYWHTSRNLPVPDGRARRKELPQKSRALAPESPTS